MLHARAADTSVRARDVACRKVRVTAWRTRTAPIRIKAWAVWAEVDRGAVVEGREVEAGEWGGGAGGGVGGGGGGGGGGEGGGGGGGGGGEGWWRWWWASGGWRR